MGEMIQSKEVIDKISDELKIQPSMKIPRELADKIQLIYNVNPARLIQIKSANAVDSTSGTIHTTHAVKRTFITGATVSVTKDVVSTSVISEIKATMLNQSSAGLLIRMRYEPVTAGQFIHSVIFDPPVELAKGTSVTTNNSTAIASIDNTGLISFYETDPE